MLADCVERSQPDTDRLEIVTDVNPFYLRGDFDGDGGTDYVARIFRRSLDPTVATDRSGLAFCPAAGSVAILGASLGALPEGADPDLFISPSWEAVPPESPELTSLDAIGDVIVMPWEDGAGLIFWKNGKFYWRWIE